MKKRILVIFMTLVLVLCAGCAQTSASIPDPDAENSSSTGSASESTKPSGSRVELQFWNHLNPTNALHQWCLDVVDEFNASQDKYTIVFDSVPIDEYMNTKLPTAFATGSGPDIFYASPGNIGQFLDGEVCVPLEEYLTEDEMNDFVSGTLDVSTRNGHLYGIPTMSDLCNFWYNADMLKEAGVEPPKTWSELKSAAAACNTNEHSGFTFEINKGDWQTWSFMPFVWMQDGGDFFDEKGNPLLDSDQVINALQLWRDLLDSGSCTETLSRSCSDIGILADGETAMQMNGSWAPAVLEANYPDVNLVAAEIPIPDENGHTATVAGGWRVLVNKETASIEGCMEFIRFAYLDNPPEKSSSYLTYNFGYSARQSVIDANKDLYLKGQRAVFTEVLNPSAKAELAIPAEASEILSDMIQDALYNMTPTEAAQKAQTKMLEFASSYNGILG